ncbi:hypothetical protein Tsubulata_034819 [Turnera subulata]|uniref:CCHC-type domain-containing protein n=1 Tax=Turnera subulata TaxID=218843 RepID=A0A9Q0FTZ0_9ROSI|nr:hypothetical protein Tsubulata_034819 [Turnera subulata]
MVYNILVEDEVEGRLAIVPSAEEQEALVFEEDEVETGPTELNLCLVVLLREVKGNEQPSELSVFHVPIWARAYDIPLNYRKERFIEQLGNKLGTFVHLDQERGLDPGKFIRFRFVKDVRTPLLCGSTVMLKDDREVWIYYKYERFPFFRYHCGRLGHIAKDCPYVDDADLLNPELYQRDTVVKEKVQHGESQTGAIRTEERIEKEIISKSSGIRAEDVVITSDMDKNLPASSVTENPTLVQLIL